MNILSSSNILKKYPRSSFKLSVPSLVLPSGTITGVVGENGNGKTTLLDIIAGESSAEGEFQYFGQEVDQHSNWSILKNDIGFIPQRIPKWYGTLEQNLFLKAAIEGVDESEIDARLDELLDFLDLQKFRELKWTEISTGYRLRFELARALLGEPKLLVLDEPLANLDINTQQKFLSDLKVLLAKRDYPLAVILSSQQLHEIESVADQMLFLKKGESLFSGSLAAISETETQNLFEIQLVTGNVDSLAGVVEPDAQLSNVGPYIQVVTSKSASELLTSLIAAKLELKYFRDLSNSTKRFFN